MNISDIEDKFYTIESKIECLEYVTSELLKSRSKICFNCDNWNGHELLDNDGDYKMGQCFYHKDKRRSISKCDNWFQY